MCKLCDEGMPQDHTGSVRDSRRDFLKTAAVTGARRRRSRTVRDAPRPRQDDGDPPEHSGRPGRRYVIRGGSGDVDGPGRGQFRQSRHADRGQEDRRDRAAICRRAVAPRSTPPAASSCRASSIRTITNSRRRCAASSPTDVLINDLSGSASGDPDLLRVHPEQIRPGVPPGGRLHQRAVRWPEPARRRRHHGARRLADQSLACSTRTPPSRR